MKSAPVLGQERIVTLDIIRGFALFGIFLVNMPTFHSPDFIKQLYGVLPNHSGADYWLDLFFTLFIDMKFFTIFSFLFGLGFYIFMNRLEQKGLMMGRLFTRRMIGLLIIGATHLVLLWFGDILVTYALTGLLLLLFYKRKIKTILVWAISLLIVFNMLILIPLLLPTDIVEVYDQNSLSVYNGMVDEYVLMYETAGYAEWIKYRIGTEIVPILENLIITMIPVLAMFLFGLAAGKAGIFQSDSKNLGIIRKVRTGTLVVSIPLLVILALYSLEIVDAGAKFKAVVQLFTSLSGVTLCFFYLSALTLLLQKKTWQKRLRPLGYAGQMALTNYLSQTIISVSIFVGFGFYGKVSLLGGTLLSIVIFVAQIIFSYFWLKKFQFGPFEWLWRSFTYWKIQSLKKKELVENVLEKEAL